MTKINPIPRLLVNKTHRSAAMIKYETKQLEVRLKRIFELASKFVEEKVALDPVVRPKAPVMWLDAMFQSAMKSTVAASKKEAAHLRSVKIDQLFNAIAAQQAAAFSDKNSVDD